MMGKLFCFVAAVSLLCTQGADLPGSAVARKGETVAELNGVKITREEFEKGTAAKLFPARNSYYDAEKKSLEEFVESKLVEAEAKKQGLTVVQLFEKNVTSKLPPDPSDDALRVYFEGLDTKETFEDVRGKIRDHLRQRRIERLKTAYLNSLRQEAKIAILLTPPRANVPLENVKVRGSRTAPVTIVEYADYECPYCQQLAPAIAQLEEKFKGKVAFAYKDVPLPNHLAGRKAAEAKLCAGEQGKYWEYHDLLISTMKLQPADLSENARKLQLDTAAFEGCLKGGSTANAIQAHLTEAQNLGVQGTPSLFINGRFFSGILSYEKLQEIVEEELGATSDRDKRAGR